MHAVETLLTAEKVSGSVPPLTGEISSLTMLPIVVFNPVLQTTNKVFFGIVKVFFGSSRLLSWEDPVVLLKIVKFPAVFFF